jgi:hypothetical protein
MAIVVTRNFVNVPAEGRMYAGIKWRCVTASICLRNSICASVTKQIGQRVVLG